MAASRKSKPRRPAARRRTTRGRSRRRRNVALPRIRLAQRHYDVLGLGLVAVAVFLGCVIYGHWDGGRVGDWLARALASAIGGARLGAPVACAGAGVLLVMRPVIPNVRPLRVGAILLFVAATLALAAAGPSRGIWSTAAKHGGALGAAEL